jgi:predicted PurR-regulated permease PerM
LIIAGFVAGFAGLAVLLGNSFQDLATKLPQYQESLGDMIEKTAARFPKLARSVGATTGPELETGVRLIQSALLGLSDFLSQAFLVVIYLLFILAERAGVARRLESSFPLETARHVQDVVRAINASIAQYIVVKTVMGLVAGALTTTVALAFGVDYAALWGVLAFLFNYIPYLGSILATLAPVLLSLVQYQDVWTTLWILIALFVMQIAIGYLIEPRIAGRTLDLSPLVIIVSLAFWGSLWGIVGMVLAVPLMVVIRAILENTLATRPLARLLSNA